MVSLSRQISLAGITGLALLCLCAPVWAVDGRIQGMRYDAATGHFRIDSAGDVKATVNTLNIAGHKRIIIDLDNAEIGVNLPRDVQLLHDLSRQLPALKNLTVNQYAGNGRPIVRILLDIHGDPGVIRLIKNQGTHIELAFSEHTSTARNSYAQPPSLSRLNQPSDYQPAYTANRQTPSSRPPEPPTSGDVNDDELRRTLAILNRKYENLAQENHYLKAKLTTAEQGRDTDVSARQRNQQELDRLRVEVERLQNGNQDLQSQISDLRASNSRPDPSLAEKQAEIARLRSENQSLNSRLSVAMATPKGISPDRLDEMKVTLAEMNRRYDTLAQENRTLKSKLSSQTSLTASVNADKTEIERLTREKQQLSGENSRLKAELNAQSVKATNTNLNKTELARLTQEKQALSNENSRLKAELNAQSAKATNGNLNKTELARLTQEKQALSNENNRLKTELENLSSKAQTGLSDADLKALRGQLTVAQSSLSESIRTINEQNKQIAFLRNQVGDVKSGLDASAKEQIESMQARLDEKDGTIRDLQRQLVTKTSTPSGKGDSGEVNRLKQENSRAQKEIAELKTDLEKLRKLAGGTEVGKAKALEAQVVALEADLSDWKAKYEQAAKEVVQAKNASRNVTDTKADPARQTQIASLNAQLAELRKENASLRESLSAQPVNRSTSLNKEAEQDYNAAKVDLAAKKVASALGKFKEALLLDPDNSKYAIDYSIALAEDRQYAESIDVLRRYLQRNPGDRDAYNQLGKLYLLNDQPDAADQAFRRAIPLSVLNNYATTLKKLDKSEDAESIFKLALSINPKDSEVLFNLGNLYNAENKLEQARNRYLEALQIRPDFAEAHYNLGLVFSKLGNNAQAVTHLEKFLQLSPNARNAETIRAYVQKLKA